MDGKGRLRKGKEGIAVSMAKVRSAQLGRGRVRKAIWTAQVSKATNWFERVWKGEHCAEARHGWQGIEVVRSGKEGEALWFGRQSIALDRFA